MTSSSSSILDLRGVINIYGPGGCGKTSFFKKVKHIDIDHEILRVKEATIDLFSRLRYNTRWPVILDDFETVEGYPGTKELKKLPWFFIISKHPVNDPILVDMSIEFPGVSSRDYASTKGISLEEAGKLIDSVKGNLRLLELDSDFKSTRDVFMDSAEYVSELIKTKTPIQFVDRYITEHGNTLGILHENYTEYCPLERLCAVSRSISDADIIDAHIYSEISWDLMPFFNVSACLIPALHIHGTPKPGSLRPGSLWTKMNNMLMKTSRLKKLRIHRDCVPVLVLRANAKEDVPVYSSYDLDTVNQLSFTKIKPKLLQNLKKKWKS
jgi:hypothetical protein